jgi:hypothetical protein
VTTLEKPKCSACRNAVRWRIKVFDHAAGIARTAELCGRHAKPLRDGQRITDAYSVLEIAELHFVGWAK